MISAPVLVLGFNRPQKLKKLLESLAPAQPPILIVSVDGPRPGVTDDIEKVQSCRKLIDAIDWDCQKFSIFHETNLGLRKAVTYAVSWTLERHGSTIVVEDDVQVGPEFLEFADTMLKRFEFDETIGHINGYNLVPTSILTNQREQIRKTKYIESYAWATWSRAWANYDDSMSWATTVSLSDLSNILESKIGALRWKINFSDASSARIDTWAYRWMASLWSENMSIIAPNRNLVKYDGSLEGTHTFRKPHWTELPVETLMSLEIPANPSLDLKADRWLGQSVFKETALGLVEGLAASSVMGIRDLFF